jgi:hypothetical protein
MPVRGRRPEAVSPAQFPRLAHATSFTPIRMSQAVPQTEPTFSTRKAARCSRAPRRHPRVPHDRRERRLRADDGRFRRQQRHFQLDVRAASRSRALAPTPVPLHATAGARRRLRSQQGRPPDCPTSASRVRRFTSHSRRPCVAGLRPAPADFPGGKAPLASSRPRAEKAEHVFPAQADSRPEIGPRVPAVRSRRRGSVTRSRHTTGGNTPAAEFDRATGSISNVRPRDRLHQQRPAARQAPSAATGGSGMQALPPQRAEEGGSPQDDPKHIIGSGEGEDCPPFPAGPHTAGAPSRRPDAVSRKGT